MKLTKTQKARAKRAVSWEIRDVSACGIGRFGNGWFYTDDPEWAEFERLLKVALRAVERDRG